MKTIYAGELYRDRETHDIVRALDSTDYLHRVRVIDLESPSSHHVKGDIVVKKTEELL